jgi:putative hemolysin
MKQFFLIAFLLIIVAGGFFYLGQQKITTPLVEDNNQMEMPIDENQEIVNPSIAEDNVELANPASVYCLENGGQLEIITENDGGQFGLCKLEDFACEEWAFYNGGCDIEADSALIAEALIAKGLNLQGMQVIINTHLGDEIGGSVVPVSAPAGGGYVFAKKVGDEMKIVADGNGSIMCSMLSDYPDFSTYLIESCINDSSGQEVLR